MRNKFKVLALISVLVLVFQTGAYAGVSESLTSESSRIAAIGVTEPTRGVYLQIGKCYISPGSGYVTVWGSTQAYSSVSQISVKLTVYKEISTNVWSYVWSDTFTDYNTDFAYFNKQNVPVSAGRYKVEGTHTTKHGGVTESNVSVSGIVTVY